MEKTIRELNGTVCIEMEEVTPAKKQILSSRSFGHPVRDYNSLAESITLYMSRAAEKLRRQQSFAGSVYVYIRTSSPHIGATYMYKVVIFPLAPIFAPLLFGLSWTIVNCCG